MSMGRAHKFFGSLFPILFLTSPCLLCIYQLCFLIPVPFPHFPLSTSQLITLQIISISRILFLFWLFVYFFLDSVIDSSEFVVNLMFIVLISFFLNKSLNISVNNGLVMKYFFSLTLSGKHFICPSILNDKEEF